MLCEDGGGTEFLHGLTTDGVIFRFAQNTVHLRTSPVGGFDDDYRGSEFAGACYSPDGRPLFVNIMGSTSDAGTAEGRTLAIRGPWERGSL